MKRLELITTCCLKCFFMVTKKDLLQADVFCKKNLDRPTTKPGFIGGCSYKDYDKESCKDWDRRLE